jgi:hypothetical protein
MPSRVIREEVLASRSLSRCSWQADWLWQKLLLAADEFGRMDGRLEVVRSECFPSRTDVTLEQIDEWLTELSSCDPGGRGPLRRYEVDGWPYLQLVNWEKHRAKRNRAESSKFPEPPALSAEFSGEVRSDAERSVLGQGVKGSRGHPPRPPDAGSASRGSSAAGIPASSPQAKKPRRTEATPKAAPKPAARAIPVFCEEYKLARGVNPAIPPKDKPKLGEALDDMGEELFRGALKQFFKLDNEWIREASYSPGCFLAKLTQCSVRAQKALINAPLLAASRGDPPPEEPDAELRSNVRLLFGTGGL